MLALVRSAFQSIRVVAPCASRWARAQSMQPRFEFLLTVSKARMPEMASIVRGSGARLAALAGMGALTPATRFERSDCSALTRRVGTVYGIRSADQVRMA